MNERDKELADKVRFVSTATPPTQDEILQHFADLIRADEREEIATWLDDEAGSGRIISCISAAKAIRARATK